MRFELAECKTGRAADITTEAVVEIDGNVFRVEFFSEEKTRRPKYSEDNMPLYEGDVVEIFLALGERNRYLELEFNQNGAVFSAIIETRGGERRTTLTDGRKHIELETKLSDGRWETKAAIDIQWLKELGFSEDFAYGNLLREDFDEEGNMQIYAASPTYTDTFHKPSAFVKLI